MKMHKLKIAFLVSFVALTGCSFDSADETAGLETLYERLGTRETLTLEDPSLVGVAAYDKQGEPLECVQPNVMAGDAVLRATADGVLLVEAIDIDLSDIEIEAGVVFDDKPINITDIHLKLGTQIAIEPEWSPDGKTASGVGHADLLMDWALLADDGEHLPLATQRIRNAEFHVEARLERDGRVTASVTTAVDGTIWDFSAVELADFSMAVTASSLPSIR
jgi:hypothetical protein